MNTPDTMRAVQLNAYDEDCAAAIDNLKIVDRPVPQPGRHQVLVKIAAAPCNPSDLLLLQGKYGVLKTLPTIPGWEGAGTVVASGGGLYASWLNGKRVACGLQGDRDGTWAEYAVADITDCIPLKRSLTAEQGASLIVNPLTAIGLLDTARRAGHRAAVQTAAASQLGRMVLRIADQWGFPIISIVRRQAQVELLQSLGARHVLDQSQEDFVERLQDICQRLSATALFDAVAGDLTGTVLGAMPPDSVAYTYGALSETACGNIDPIDLIFRGKQVTGFYLGKWLRQRGSLGILRLANQAQRLLAAGNIETTIQRRVGFEDFVAGLRQYSANMTDGKILLLP